MTSEKRQNTRPNRARRGVRGAYTWAQVKAYVTGLLRSKSLREAARDLGLKNHSAVQRIRDGIEPRDTHTRKVLGLPDFGLAVVCREHGIAHGIQHRHKKTWAENAADYARWLTANAAELARRVKWAEGQTVPKGRL